MAEVKEQEITNEIVIEKKLNIYEKLMMITNELSIVAKNLEVGYGQNKYKAVGEADVLKAIKPLEYKYRVYSYPFSRKIIESGIVELTTNKGEIKKNVFERIEVVYRFINVDNTNEYVDITTYGDGFDSQDKSVGKAMTYADKYALLKAYKIVTGEDPDQHASEDINGKVSSIDSINTDLDIEELKNKIRFDVWDRMEKANVNIPKLAKYLGKEILQLTEEDIVNATETKEKKYGKN